MSKTIFSGIYAIGLVMWLFGCGKKASDGRSEFATDSVSIAGGQALFSKHCNSCHSFKQDGIGPRLGGITSGVSFQWIRNFIHDPDSVLKSGDPRGKDLAANYQIPMPAFSHLTNEEIRQIAAFINAHKKTDAAAQDDPLALKDPIPETIDSSDLVVELEYVTQVPASGPAPLLTRITKMDVKPGDDDLFVLDLRGKLYRVSSGKTSVYMDIAPLRKSFISEPGLATGFGSFAFHPDFPNNGLLYTTHAEPAKAIPSEQKLDFDYPDSIPSTLQWVVTEWKSSNPGALSFTGTGRELFRIKMVAGIHGVQEIAFNPTAKKGSEEYGLLYIGIGDGGAVENGYSYLTHSETKAWGTILRIDPAGKTSRNGHYGIPKSNPFGTSPDPETVREIYALGFRNPHRISWSKEGKMLAVNIGDSQIEALDLILPGHDYGWPIREGTFSMNPKGDISKVYPLPANDQNFHVTYPAAQYDHDEGKAISGGYEYTGRRSPLLIDKYFFGDIPTGNLFFVEVDDLTLAGQAKIKKWQVSLRGNIQSLVEICGNKRVDLHFGKDSKGELYILTKPDGKIYRLGAVLKNMH